MYLLLAISIARFNLILVFFKPASYAKPGTEKDYGINFIYFKTYFEISQIHQLTIMYHFEHAHHDILLKLLFEHFYKLFLCALNLYH